MNKVDSDLKPRLPTHKGARDEGTLKNGDATLNPIPSQEFPQKANPPAVDIYGGGGFIGELSFKDLQRLREIVIRKFFWHVVERRGWEYVPMVEVDKLIESYGERTRQELIKRAVDAGLSRDGYSLGSS